MYLLNPTDYCGQAINHRVLQYLFVIVDSISAIASIVGNTLVLVTIWRTPRLHSPSNVLLAGLALSDLGVGLVTQPAKIVGTMMALTANKSSRCTLDQVSTLVFVLSSQLFIFISFFTLTAISIDRYLALRLHLRYEELVTVKRVLMALLIIWTVDVLLYVLPLALVDNISSFLYPLILLPTCIVVTIWCYFKIFKIILRHQSQIQAQVVVPQNEGPTLPNIARFKKSVINILYIVGFFMIINIPWLTVAIVSNFVKPVGSIAFATVSTVVSLNSCVNPVLYCWRMGEIRQAAKKTVLGESS